MPWLQQWFSYATFEVWPWMGNYTPQYTLLVITYPGSSQDQTLQHIADLVVNYGISNTTVLEIP